MEHDVTITPKKRELAAVGKAERRDGILARLREGGTPETSPARRGSETSARFDRYQDLAPERQDDPGIFGFPSVRLENPSG